VFQNSSTNEKAPDKNNPANCRASAGVIFLIWNWNTFQSWNLPLATFRDSETVKVIDDDNKFSFQPVHKDKSLELIFFQGGMTDPRAYAPLCRRIAENGYTCHLIKMPWRLPKYGYERIKTIFNLSSHMYVIGGHSQGAMAAAQFVYQNPGQLKGLILMGTSHPKDVNLSASLIPTLKLYASNDGLASVGEVMENRHNLPLNTRLVEIPGGNHSQFGYLGHLLLDDKATISLEAQQELIVLHAVHFLDSLESQD
jgi:hypothetical protein